MRFNVRQPSILLGTGRAASYEVMKEKVTDELRRTFRPEFLNRIDEVIVFHALNREQLKAIIEIMVKTVVKQLADRQIRIQFTPAAKALLAEKGYDPISAPGRCGEPFSVWSKTHFRRDAGWTVW